MVIVYYDVVDVFDFMFDYEWVMVFWVGVGQMVDYLVNMFCVGMVGCYVYLCFVYFVYCYFFYGIGDFLCVFDVCNFVVNFFCVCYLIFIGLVSGSFVVFVVVYQVWVVLNFLMLVLMFVLILLLKLFFLLIFVSRVVCLCWKQEINVCLKLLILVILMFCRKLCLVVYRDSDILVIDIGVYCFCFISLVMC